MNKEKLQAYAYLTICGFGIAVLVFLFFRYVLMLLLPFALAFLLAYLLRRPAESIAKKLHLSVRFSRMVFSLLALLILFCGIGFLVYAVASEAWRFVSGLSESGKLQQMLSAILRFPHGILGSGETAAEWEEQLSSAISAAASSASSTGPITSIRSSNAMAWSARSPDFSRAFPLRSTPSSCGR